MHRKAAKPGRFIVARYLLLTAPKPNATSRQTAHHRMVVRASDVDDELAAVSAAVEVSILSPQIHSKHRHASISN